MEDQAQNKSEQATPFKLTRAREKGAVARGLDLGFLTSLTAFLGFAWISGPGVRAQLAQSAQRAFISAPQIIASPYAILTITGAVFSAAAHSIVWMAAIVFAVVFVSEFIQTGPVFTFEPFKLDFSRLSPANGFKRVFSVRLLIETAKSIFKFIVYVAITLLIIRFAISVGAPAITDAGSLASSMVKVGLRLLSFFVFAALLFALVDQVIARRGFQKRMRMTRRDVRREARDREGDPRIKQRRKQLHRQFVKLRQSVRNVKGADVLITNPTHFAVALKYDSRTMTAPIIVSQATNHYALRIKKLAFVYGVVIVQNPVLARALFQRGELNKQIPEAYFRPVAEIYLAMRARKSAPSAVGDVRV